MTAPTSISTPGAEAAGISVVIPVWREDAQLASTLEAITSWPEVQEVIVSAVAGAPGFVRTAEAAGARCLLSEAPNRGRQLNLGARDARSHWLLFHHADSHLTRAHVEALAALTARTDVVGGAFYRKFDMRHPGCRWLEPIERWHNRTCGALYGDQSIFVRRRHFEEMGGFSEIPLMEDVDFSRRLRRSGRIALLDPPLASSPRKHLNGGPWRTTLRNATLLALYKAGVSPARLHTWYYADRRNENPSIYENELTPAVHPSPSAWEAPR